VATNESAFKLEFRKSGANLSDFMIWPQNDMFQSGVPDMAAVYKGRHISIEAKFVSKLPARDSSKVLTHELSELQHGFLKRVSGVGALGVLLIGFDGVAVAFTGDDVKINYTVEEIKRAPRIYKLDGGKWDIKKFLEVIKA